MITRAANCLLLCVLYNGLITSHAFQVSPARLTVLHPFSTATAMTSPSYRTHWLSTALYESSKSQQQQQQKGNKVAKSQHVQLMATYLSHQLVSVLKKNPPPSKKMESTTQQQQQQQDSVDSKTSSLMDVKDATTTAAGTALLQRDDAPETSSSLTPRDDVEELEKTIQQVQDAQQKAESVLGAENLAQVAFSESTDPFNNQMDVSGEVSNTDNDNEVDGASTGGEKSSSFKTLLKSQIDADSRRKQQMDAEKSESLHKKEGDRIVALKDEFMTGDDEDGNAVDNVDTVLQDPEPLTVKEESTAIELEISNEQVDSSSTDAETIALPVEDEPNVEETVASKEEATLIEKEEKQKEEEEKEAISDMESLTSETVDSSIDLDEDTAGEVELEAVTEAVSTAEDVVLATSEPAQDTSDQKIEDTTVSKVEEQLPTLEVVAADAAVQDAEIVASNALDAAAPVPQSDEPIKEEEVLVTANVEEGEIEDSHDEAVISKDAAPVLEEADLHPSTSLNDLAKEEGAVTEMLDKTAEDVEKEDLVDLSAQELSDNDANTPTAEVASDKTSSVAETKETPTTVPPAAVTITMPESLAVKVANDFYDARGMFIPKKPAVISDAFGKPLEVIKAGVPPLREAMTRSSTAVAAAAPSSSTPPPTSLKAVMTKPGQLLEPTTFSLEEQAFATLRDLGMIKETPNPCDEHYDHSDDDTLCPDNKWKS